MDDDLNSPMVISALFDWVRTINQIADGKERISAADLETLRQTVHRYAFEILGLRDEKGRRCRHGPRLRNAAGRDAARYPPAGQGREGLADFDRIRDGLTAAGIRVKDRKEVRTGSWSSVHGDGTNGFLEQMRLAGHPAGRNGAGRMYVHVGPAGA